MNFNVIIDYTGLYRSHKNQDNPSDETPIEPPNLCRRPLKVTPQNSILKDLEGKNPPKEKIIKK